jgi:hypothetical protein
MVARCAVPPGSKTDSSMRSSWSAVDSEIGRPRTTGRTSVTSSPATARTR